MAVTIALIINDATALTITLSDHSTIRPNRTPISWPGNDTNQVMQVHIPTSPAVASWLEYFQADTGILLTHPTLDELLMDRMAGCDCFHSRFDRKPSDKRHLREVCYCHVTQRDGCQVLLMTRAWHWPLQLTSSSCWPTLLQRRSWWTGWLVAIIASSFCLTVQNMLSQAAQQA